MRARTWVVENHLCKACGGRILRCVSGAGPTGGGNPIFMCADCERSISDMGPDALCWCGFSHRNQNLNGYQCVPYSILKERPELLNAFRACGCDPSKDLIGVGIMLQRDLHKKEQ